MRTVIVVGPDQIENWLKMKQEQDNKPCDCTRIKDLTVGLGPVRNLYCPDCKKHIYNGVEFTKEQWNAWINSNVCCKITDGKLVVHHEDGREQPVKFEELMEMVGYKETVY